MRILICSRAFAPSVGGLEAVARMLAEGFAEQGNEVRVVTMVAGEEAPSQPYELFRRPTPARLLMLHRWANVALHMNVSLRWHWAALAGRARVVLVHHGVYEGNGWTGRALAGLKRRATHGARNIAVSQFVANRLPIEAQVIPNAYDDTLFRLIPELDRHCALVFLGRLVSDKGANILLDALALLAKLGLRPTLTIIGGGPEEGALRVQCARLRLDGQVTFAGVQRGRALAELLNAHRVMVVPSLWEEPFGIVALEGIACGCIVVGSSGGGLPEAIGPCGVTFPNGDIPALAGRIEEALRDEGLRSRCLEAAPEHLSRHTSRRIVEDYLAVLSKAVQ